MPADGSAAGFDVLWRMWVDLLSKAAGYGYTKEHVCKISGHTYTFIKVSTFFCYVSTLVIIYRPHPVHATDGI